MDNNQNDSELSKDKPIVDSKSDNVEEITKADELESCESSDAKEESKEPSMEDKFAELEAKCKDLEGAYLRKVADFDNYRKRMIKEKQEALVYANSKLLEDLLPILDNFDRAIDSGVDKKNEALKGFANGIVMIREQLESMLTNDYGLTYYPSKGELFDPNLHEAVAMNPSADVTEQIVGEELQKGYKLKEKVLRHSKVMVLMPEEKKVEGSEKE